MADSGVIDPVTVPGGGRRQGIDDANDAFFNGPFNGEFPDPPPHVRAYPPPAFSRHV